MPQTLGETSARVNIIPEIFWSLGNLAILVADPVGPRRTLACPGSRPPGWVHALPQIGRLHD
jgi:hypothetical protein